jgi:hypothetical protein
MKHLLAWCVAVLCVVASATVAAVATWPHAPDVRTEDRNGDGRPDVWRQYDDQGQPTEVGIDTNFDGRSDIQEYYEHGTLVRRESDRNFDDRVDLVEEFDTTTHEHIRSIVDVDYDGSADLLVLFQDGRPVFSKQVSSLTVNPRQTGNIVPQYSQLVRRRGDLDRLAPLTDPFRVDTSIGGTQQASSRPDSVGLSTSGGLPESCIHAVSPVAPSARFVARDVQAGALAHLSVPSPRGPPLS